MNKHIIDSSWEENIIPDGRSVERTDNIILGISLGIMFMICAGIWVFTSMVEAVVY
jgi:hypothetical protein